MLAFTQCAADLKAHLEQKQKREEQEANTQIEELAAQQRIETARAEQHRIETAQADADIEAAAKDPKAKKADVVAIKPTLMDSNTDEEDELFDEDPCQVIIRPLQRGPLRRRRARAPQPGEPGRAAHSRKPHLSL